MSPFIWCDSVEGCSPCPVCSQDFPLVIDEVDEGEKGGHIDLLEGRSLLPADKHIRSPLQGMSFPDDVPILPVV
jgi:hypothetical protein